MSENLSYQLQFNVITFSPTGKPIQVCFHARDKEGFPSVEIAKKVIAALEKADTEANKIRIYEIIPVLVSDKYGEIPEVNFDFEDEANEIDKMIEAAENEDEDNNPPISN